MTTIDIIGGGVAGLALAGALDPARFRVRLHEPGSTGHRLGTAFGMWPPAMRALGQLGLDDAVRAAGFTPSGAAFATSSGRVVARVPAPEGTVMVPRPALLGLLEGRVPPQVERVAERVEDPRALDGDVVVAADGAYSVVRRAIWGDGARDTGVMAVRGVARGRFEELGLGVPHEWWGGRSLFGIGPTVDGINWYASMASFDCTPDEALAWCREHFTTFPAAIGEVLRRAEPGATLVNRIVEAPATRTLVRDRFVLVGDAAHAMSPNLGRGACEAVVDAVTLAEELSTRPLAEALRRYDRRRVLPGQAVRVGSAAMRRLGLAWH